MDGVLHGKGTEPLVLKYKRPLNMNRIGNRERWSHANGQIP